MRFRGVLVVSLALAFGACGSDDEPSGGGGAGGAGSGGVAGESGNGGSSGASAGSGGSSGSGGVAGSAGVAASAGAGGDAGVDGGEDASAGAAGESDAGSDAPLEAPADAGSVPLPGFGAIFGDCGPIDATEITSPSPFSFETSIDFGTLSFDYNALSPGGKEVFDDGNLGGNSLYSEIFSYEVLYRCELALLLKTEAEVLYTNTAGKKTDLLVQIDGYKLGVSVTRAFAYPAGSTFSPQQAESLLTGKLSDILLSTANVAATDAWQKQILHVLAYNQQHRDALFQAYPMVPAATRADTIVLVTVTDGNDAFIY